MNTNEMRIYITRMELLLMTLKERAMFHKSCTEQCDFTDEVDAMIEEFHEMNHGK